MSHPRNRLERFVIGNTKGKKRGEGYWKNCNFKDLIEKERFLKLATAKRRNTTKLCSCYMCGNQRKIYGYTLQEKRFESSLKDI